jgi:hypothetical protein
VTSAQSKYCLRSKSWFKPAKKNGGVNELYLWNETFGFAVLTAWPVDDTLMRQGLKFHKCVVPDSEIRPLEKNGAKAVFEGTGRYFIFLTRDDDAIFSDIPHEAFHVVADALLARGIKPDLESGEESWAYTIGWLTSEVLKMVILAPKVMQPPGSGRPAVRSPGCKSRSAPLQSKSRAR